MRRRVTQKYQTIKIYSKMIFLFFTKSCRWQTGNKRSKRFYLFMLKVSMLSILEYSELSFLSWRKLLELKERSPGFMTRSTLLLGALNSAIWGLHKFLRIHMYKEFFRLNLFVRRTLTSHSPVTLLSNLTMFISGSSKAEFLKR